MLPLVFVRWLDRRILDSSYHIGFEGQIIVGGIIATLVGLHVAVLPAAVHLPSP